MTPEQRLALYRKNLAQLSDREPGLFQYLKEQIEKFETNPNGLAGEMFPWDDRTTPPTLHYLRQEPAFQASFGGPHAEQEAAQVMRESNLDHPSTVVIFGLGLGYGLKEFLKNRPHTNFCILIIEKNAQMFLRAMCAHDWSKELDDDTISWVVCPDIPTLSTKLMIFFSNNSTVDRYLKVIPTPASVAADTPYYEEAARTMLRIRDTVTVLFGNSVEDQLLGLKNVFENVIGSIANPGITPLYDQFRGKTIISIAAGPSANEHFDSLKRLQGKVPMIACESILKPLNDYGIYPDFVTAMERDDYVPKFFRNIKIYDRTSLVAPTLLMKECFDLYTGHKILYSPGQGWTEPLGLDYLGNFFPGSSAGNLNVSFASILGFKNIIMVGHNLAYGYKTNETHVRGTIDPDRERSRSEEELKAESRGLKRPTQDGEDEVWTRVEWNLFREQMELHIANHNDRTFINTAPKGSLIAGTVLMPFEEAIQKYHTEDFDIYPEKMKLLKSVPEDVIDERLNQIKIRTQKTLDSVRKWNDAGFDIKKKLKKWEAKIQKAELKGGRVNLDYLNEALDELLKVKVEAINVDVEFYYFAIIMILPIHIAFERNLNQMRAEYKEDYMLKRDFLLRHKQYFNIWNKVLPELITRLEGLIATFEDRQVSAWGGE
jgi:hypothetical protein